MKRIILTYVVVPVAFWVGLFLIGIVFGGFPDTPLRQVVMIAMLIGYCFALWFWLRRKLAQVEDSSNTEETVVLKTPSQSAKSYAARTQREDRSPANHERQDAIFRFFLFGVAAAACLWIAILLTPTLKGVFASGSGGGAQMMVFIVFGPIVLSFYLLFVFALGLAIYNLRNYWRESKG